MGFATTAGTRLRLIELALNSGKKNTLEAFWKMVESFGAPLVEYCDADEESVFITFVY